MNSNKLKNWLIFFCLLLPAFVSGKPVLLSDEAKVSILTLGPDHDNLYSSFWHSAIRVKDDTRGIDWVYDYGRFDFDNPNFYTDFAKGYLRYKIGMASFKRFQAAYIYFNRDIEEQVLNLSKVQKQRVYEYLQHNVRPENQYYFYDYYYNNCATKIRDVFVEILGDSLIFDFREVRTQYSFRDLTHRCTQYKPWGEYGIDLALGSPIDKVINPYEYMFLPEYVRESFSTATLLNFDGEVQPVVKEFNQIHMAHDEPVDVPLITPDRIFWLLFMVVFVITLVQWKRVKSGKWLDITIFTIFGLLGLVLTGIWFFTDHKAAAGNYNLIWSLPTHMLTGILLLIPTLKQFTRYYFLLTSIILTILLLCWSFLPQDLHEDSIPLILILLMRSGFIYWNSSRAKSKERIVKQKA
jgi:hypothetical protein